MKNTSERFDPSSTFGLVTNLPTVDFEAVVAIGAAEKSGRSFEKGQGGEDCGVVVGGGGGTAEQ